MTTLKDGDLLTAKEAGKLADCSSKTIRNWIANGTKCWQRGAAPLKLPGQRRFGKMLVTVGDLRSFLKDIGHKPGF